VRFPVHKPDMYSEDIGSQKSIGQRGTMIHTGTV